MRTWLALIVAPAIALAAQAVMYALVTPSCSLQTRLLIHLVAGGALLGAAVLALLARGEWKRKATTVPGGPDSAHGDAGSTRRFLAAAGTAVAALSTLVIATMWFGAWVLSPCWQ